jgi:hypothetical protein
LKIALCKELEKDNVIKTVYISLSESELFSAIQNAIREAISIDFNLELDREKPLDVKFVSYADVQKEERQYTEKRLAFLKEEEERRLNR